jgi:rod shape-determining protein MreD
MFIVWYILTVGGVLLIQTSPWLSPLDSGWRVDLVLLVVVYYGLFWRGERALVLGFLAGLWQDALSSEVLGLHALSKTLTVFVVQTACRNVQVNSLIAQVVFTGLAILVDLLARTLAMMLFQLQTFEPETFLPAFVRQTVLSLCLGPFVCRGLQALAKSFRLRQGKGDAVV